MFPHSVNLHSHKKVMQCEGRLIGGSVCVCVCRERKRERAREKRAMVCARSGVKDFNEVP